MCRLYGFLANEPTKVECTLVHAQNALMAQSREDRRGESHTDGWGIAYFENGHPTLEKRATAAHADRHFSLTAERIFTTAVVAHVRQATVGEVAVRNTHPFVAGRWVGAHNGTVRGIETVGPTLEAELSPGLRRLRRGDTDSELAVYWLLQRLADAGVDLEASGVDLAVALPALAAAVATLAARSAGAVPDRPPRLNFVLTNGSVLLASRWNNGLFVVERDGIHDCEICGIPHVHHATGRAYRATVVASEPISHERWEEVPEGSVLGIDAAVRVHRLAA